MKKQAFESSDTLDLNHNPTELHIRPVVGDIAKCNGVLLKIQVMKSRTNPDKKKYVTTVAGMVEKSCTFNSIYFIFITVSILNNFTIDLLLVKLFFH